MDYSLLRQFADSWGLLYLFLLFAGVIAFTFRPGSKAKADENEGRLSPCHSATMSDQVSDCVRSFS